jgi:SAM-dependent methyltransferase
VDPWVYRGRAIPEKRREFILDDLRQHRYSRLLEIGCAEGWMTALLAELTDELVSIDISEVALARSRESCNEKSNVVFAKVDILNDPLPDGLFDGIVCAGVLVYLPKAAQMSFCERVVSKLKEHGVLLLEHTLIRSPGEVAGPFIHSLYRERPDLNVISHQEIHNPDNDNYAITMFRKVRGEPENSNSSLS